MFRFRRFRTQLLVFFLGLLLIVQAAVFLSTRAASERDATARVTESLVVAGGALERILTDRDERLLEAGHLLAADFAFKSAYSTRDVPTIESMLDNHGERIGADWMALLSLDREVIADTLHAPGEAFAHPELVEAALDDPHGEAARIVFVDGRAYQAIILPLLAPLHDAWIVIGFVLGDELMHTLRSFAMAEMSLVRTDRDPPAVLASTHDAAMRTSLHDALEPVDELPGDAFQLQLAGDTYLTLGLRLPAEGGIPLYALMQRSLDEVLAPYRQLHLQLALLFLGGLLVAAAGAAMIARGVSRPLTALAASARRIAGGDYTPHVELARRDELGALGEAFNHMAHGLAERDRVRNLLGMVVSPQIAEELMSREIALGGEEREVTVLFADCRGFTTLGETLPPAELLGRLNELLTVLTDTVERHGGVVDKYIGDAVMALFGAPIAHDDDPVRAVACALEMAAAARALNSQRPDQEMDISVGINTGLVVAGNMGSTTRLNYSVVGDAVNLAARVETLTRQYGVDVLVTESTRDACGDAFTWREIDRVQVKGRQQPVVLFEPRQGPL